MNRNFLFSIGILLLCTFTAFAQNVIKGNVIEKATGAALPGVSIIVKGTTTGTSTDFDGNFELYTNEDQVTLEFSYVGFEDVTLQATSGTAVSVALEESSQSLDEVVVIGYGTARKKDLTGAVSVAGVKDFNKGMVVSAPQLIQGKVAGVNVTTGGGAPGSGQTIRIRGTGSLTLNNDPLIVIDGVPMSDQNVGGSRNILNSINPDDIKTMTILKDASSTAIYGSRAANGVVLITTKTGRKNQELKVTFNSNVSASEIMKEVPVLSVDQFRDLINRIGSETQINKMGTSRTNWQDEIYRTAISTENNVSLSGGLEGLPYRFSAAHTNANGVLKTDNMQRVTTKLSLTPTFLDDKLKVQFNANGSFVKNHFADNGAIGSAVGYDPTQAVYDPNSKYGGYTTWIDPNTGNKSSLAPTNPLALLNLRSDKSDVNRFISNLKLDYNMPFLPEMTATLNVGIDYAKGNGTVNVDPQMPSSNGDFNGSKNVYNNMSRNTLLDFYLNYVKDFTEDQSFNATVGYSYQKFRNENDATNSEFFKSNPDRVVATIDKWQSVLVSFFGRATYSIKDKYIFKGTLRADASSKLNPNDRWGYFPSASFAWSLADEEFLADADNLTNLKFRIGYGQVGNVNGLRDYLYLTNYTRNEAGAFYRFGNGYSQTYRPEAYNSAIKWEVGNTFNLGIDYGFFDNRINGSLEFYQKVSKDLIASSDVDPFTNFGNRIEANIGDMTNRGIELAISATPIRNDNLNWTIDYNIAYNTNEISNMPVTQETGGIAGGTGNNIQRHIKGLPAASFFVYEQIYNEQGKPIEGAFVDRNKDGKITEDDKYFYKDPAPDVIMGLSTNLTYKQWDFNMATRANIGNYVYNNNASANSSEIRATANDILGNLNADYLNAGFKNQSPETLQSDYYITNASFFKIDNVTLGYTMPKLLDEKLGLRVYTTVQNVAFFSKYDGIDPEISNGIDNNFYPRPRTYLLGINANF